MGAMQLDGAKTDAKMAGDDLAGLARGNQLEDIPAKNQLRTSVIVSRVPESACQQFQLFHVIKSMPTVSAIPRH